MLGFGDGLYVLVTGREQPTHVPFEHEDIDNVPDPTERRSVIHDVDHERSISRLLEAMFVTP